MGQSLRIRDNESEFGPRNREPHKIREIASIAGELNIVGAQPQIDMNGFHEVIVGRGERNGEASRFRLIFRTVPR